MPLTEKSESDLFVKYFWVFFGRDIFFMKSEKKRKKHTLLQKPPTFETNDDKNKLNCKPMATETKDNRDQQQRRQITVEKNDNRD